ncbi:MAG TPA: acetyl-CoA hydrolase/transferase C-terminal domain-containing protein, partial [Burkholderiales bacterium]
CVPDGATIETGIGALPNAVVAALRGRELNYHSGAICDEVSSLRPRRCVGGALMGTQALFDWARENPALELVSSDETHGAPALARLERFVAINSAVEVDFTGQVNGELARGSYVGAVGGALDFVRAANQSSGGVSIMVLPGARIVERLSGPVSVPRSEAGLVVTEHGVADLRGCTLAERERRMRAISGKS